MRAGASTFDRENRLRFGERDVARCYAFRPPYAAALYQYVLGVVDGRDRLLDIGCGPGKIAHVLAPHFASVVAVDPSGPMLEAAREHATTPNIRWVLGDAESADFSGPFDLITIGAAVHWLRHDIIFPRMADWLANRPARHH